VESTFWKTSGSTFSVSLPPCSCVPKMAGPVRIFSALMSLINLVTSLRVPGIALRYFPGTWTPKITMRVVVSSRISLMFLAFFVRL